MTVLEFFRSHEYEPGDEIRIPIRLNTSGAEPFAVTAVLDTGASYSLFDSGLAPDLGIGDLHSGQRISLRLANNEPAEGFTFDVEMEILGHELMASVIFCPGFRSGVDNLLGVRGILDQLEVAILHRDRRIWIRG